MKKIKKIEAKTSAQIITQTFVRIFMVFLLLITIIVSGVVAFTSLQIRESEGTLLLSSIHEAARIGKIDWKEFNLESKKEEPAAFIRITKDSGEVHESQGTHQFLTASRMSWGYFSFSENDVFWYTSLHSHGSKSELWLNINIVIQSMVRAIVAIILVMLLLFFAALTLIKKSANTISQPLSDLAIATDELETTQLPVVQKPAEVERLTQSFNRLLARLNQKIEQEQQFVSDASHELRTPVAAIRGHVTLLKRRWHEHPEIVDDSLSYIDEESLRMKRLIEELLTITRGNHLKMQRETFDLTDFTDRVIREIQPALTQEMLFEGTANLMVTADKHAIHHILVAFLENAGKYSPANSKIKITLKQENSEIDLSIADEGIGIPDEEKNKIFERFYRVDKSRSSEIPGTGLGLAIAQQYAQANGAKVFVTDHLPKGSVFHLVL